jgi:phage portal protein BeeE
MADDVGHDGPGKPSPYDPKTFPRTAKFLAQRGATLSEIADCFGVVKVLLSLLGRQISVLFDEERLAAA